MDKTLREALLNIHSHMSFEEAVEDFPIEFINQNPPSVSYSPWQLLEHIRFTQKDLLNYILKRDYKDPSWPEDYWPGKGKKATKASWEKTVKQIHQDQQKIREIVKNPKTDLFSEVVGGEGSGHNILREVLLGIDHLSYHLGEFCTWRDIQDTWPKNRRG